ncbi:Pnap_2097 family protein [Rhizobium sp. FY34]|uniref:Pnap_2097 family protein n=1 Tax=Rhizobium sp. FY34 TaxID=2562309 RepID=UPI0010C13854|nr:Pnap_2097 family protein [Rhizobium sp. FY34]
MNLVPRHPLQGLCAPRSDVAALVDAALTPKILLGMPHLTPLGLSRTWLLKELGHRHWLLLARRLGLETADFRTPDGGEAYAAISALKIHAGLSRGRANAVLSIQSELYATSDTRMESLHRLQIDGRDIGSVVLQSVFVARSGQGNRSIKRSLVRHFQTDGSLFESRLTQDVVALRLWNEPDHEPDCEMHFHPSPLEEFNGAGLLYFAEYMGLLGRALFHWEGQAAVERLDQPVSVLFSGNTDVGETLRISGYRSPDRPLLNRCVIQRTDGSVLVRALIG